jgi:hypothetical protein
LDSKPDETDRGCGEKDEDPERPNVQLIHASDPRSAPANSLPQPTSVEGAPDVPLEAMVAARLRLTQLCNEGIRECRGVRGGTNRYECHRWAVSPAIEVLHISGCAAEILNAATVGALQPPNRTEV